MRFLLRNKNCPPAAVTPPIPLSVGPGAHDDFRVQAVAAILASVWTIRVFDHAAPPAIFLDPMRSLFQYRKAISFGSLKPPAGLGTDDSGAMEDPQHVVNGDDRPQSLAT